MLDAKQFSLAIKQIAQEKGISEESIIETINAALAAAYKRDYGEKGQIIKAKLDLETGQVRVWRIRYVIEGIDSEGYVIGEVIKLEDGEKEIILGQRRDFEQKGPKPESDKEKGMEEELEDPNEIRIKYNPEKHITLEEVKELDSKLNVGDELVTPLEEKTDFGRIAAQTAKQVVIQRLREAERSSILDEFRTKIGEVISAVVQRKEGRIVHMDIGRTTALLLPVEQSPADNYTIGSRFRLMILNIEETNRGPVILLSRSHPKLLQKLFEFEVPEIANDSVEIKGVARDIGHRAKIAVISKQQGVDPIGSLVGQKGIRVQTVIQELSGEKIDIIQWDEAPEKFIANAMSPAKVQEIKIIDSKKRYALVQVAEDQFSLAIGKHGQNVSLAAKLTGWKLDVRSPKEEHKASKEDLSVVDFSEKDEVSDSGQKE